MERRFLRKSAPVVSETGNLNGRAIAYDQWTMIGKAPYGFREKVNPKALNKTTNDGDMVLLDNHDSAKPLARQSAGTLILRNGAGGLDWDTVNLADTSYAKDAVKNARAGNYGGCSFGFDIVREKWGVGSDGVEEREILEAKVPEISICTFPAYGQTSVSARSQFDAAMEARDRFYAAENRQPPESALDAARAAKASYSDTSTCGNCGATSQYGSFCGDCGTSMSQPAPSNKFCPSCGAAAKYASTRADDAPETPETRADAPTAKATDGQNQDHPPVKGGHTHSGDDAKAHTHNSDNGYDHSSRSEPVTATREDEARKMRLRMIDASFKLADLDSPERR